MLPLPPLTTEERVWRFSLTSTGAARLVNVLLEADIERRATLLRPLVMEEPGLLLWCVCRHFRSEPPTLDQVLHRLATQLLPALATDRQPTNLPVSEESLEPFPAPTNSTNPCDSDSTLMDLLHLAASELGARQQSASPDCDAGTIARFLPAWLHDKPQLIAANDSESSAEPTPLFTPAEFGDNMGPGERQSREPALGESRTTAPSIQLNQLAQRLLRLEELESRFGAALETAKLASLKELAYGASHEINNPLANISTRAQSLLREERDPERRRKLATINSQAFRAHEMIADLMMFAKPPASRPVHVDILPIINQVLLELAPEAQEQGTIVQHTSECSSLVISADAEQLAVAIKAMCTNALQALGSEGRLDVCARRFTETPQDQLHSDTSGVTLEEVEIQVRDTGPGISPQIRPHIFDPFFSGREAGRGLGFGLAKCWRIITAHGGSIRVASEPGQGTIFSIRLPGR